MKRTRLWVGALSVAMVMGLVRTASAEPILEFDLPTYDLHVGQSVTVGLYLSADRELFASLEDWPVGGAKGLAGVDIYIDKTAGSDAVQVRRGPIGSESDYIVPDPAFEEVWSFWSDAEEEPDAYFHVFTYTSPGVLPGDGISRIKLGEIGFTATQAGTTTFQASTTGAMTAAAWAAYLDPASNLSEPELFSVAWGSVTFNVEGAAVPLPSVAWIVPPALVGFTLLNRRRVVRQ